MYQAHCTKAASIAQKQHQAFLLMFNLFEIWSQFVIESGLELTIVSPSDGITDRGQNT